MARLELVQSNSYDNSSLSVNSYLCTICVCCTILSGLTCFTSQFASRVSLGFWLQANLNYINKFQGGENYHLIFGKSR